MVGIDEVGRGAFAGPLVAAGVIIDKNTNPIPGVNDSKKLSRKIREKLDPLIRSQALAYYIAEVDVAYIDHYGVGAACHKAFLEICASIDPAPDYHLIDGKEIPGIFPQKAIISGDARCYSIAAASIIAKVYRDKVMQKLHTQYSVYGFDAHVGYGTQRHREQISQHGLCPAHRRSFIHGFT